MRYRSYSLYLKEYSASKEAPPAPNLRGRFGGKAVIDEFTELRWITIEGRQHYPF
jgi:hypothetical protein